MLLAKVITIYKSGSNQHSNDYRPNLNLIFEKADYNRIISFIDQNNVLHEYQFGFLREQSTQHALITLPDTISRALDNSDMLIGVFLDLKKVFDCVNHNILLNKLYMYGVRVNIHKCLSSYLNKRNQNV